MNGAAHTPAPTHELRGEGELVEVGGAERPPSRRSRQLRYILGPVLHPDERFRSVWNAVMALLIIYCSVTIPLEIAFEDDMILTMCGTSDDFEALARDSLRLCAPRIARTAGS